MPHAGDPNNITMPTAGAAVDRTAGDSAGGTGLRPVSSPPVFSPTPAQAESILAVFASQDFTLRDIAEEHNTAIPAPSRHPPSLFPDTLGPARPPMYYLIYTSSASRLLTDPELAEIHRDAIAGNVKRGITGFLLYRDGNFMQLLEGDEVVVRTLYATICADARHKDIYLIDEGNRPDRIFSKFAMGFANMDKLPGEGTYREFMNDSLNSLRYRRDGRLALRLLESFNQIPQ